MKKEYIMVKDILEKLVIQLKDELKKHPYFLINEYDLQAYLYNKLAKEDSCKYYPKDAEGDENYSIHCEYPRGYYKNNDFKSIGRWDLAILKKEQNNDFWWTHKAVSIGFELKLHINATLDHIKDRIKSERYAVESPNGKNEYADWSILFHINIGKKVKDKTYVSTKKYIDIIQEKNLKTFYVYIESYKDKSEPEVIFSCPAI